MTKTPNRLFYTLKFNSSFIKAYKYNINLSFEECLKAGYVISLSDSQMLKTIRDITDRHIDREQLEVWFKERNDLKKGKNSSKKKQKLKEVQKKIYDMMYIPEYITVVIESEKDYERIFKKGFTYKGKKYFRGSCSASQARVSTIVFIQEDVLKEVKVRLNNGRDESHPLAASKYNAYFGLYSSASKPVTKPRFCIVPDYLSSREVDVSWSIETDWDKDDIIEDRTITNEFDRHDGCGLISPAMAEQWGKDIGEDYTPCQFCIRTSFTKGLVDEFDFVEFCRDEVDKPEEEKYLITDIYGKVRDLREVDVILTEGMAKLWDSWESQEVYEECCGKNGIDWRVTKYSPKKDKEAGLLNYQYLQTLNLDTSISETGEYSDDIKDICKDTIDYIQGVSLNDIYYTMLFCLGQKMNIEDIEHYMNSSDNYWIKSLILNHNLFNDKYTKEKIRDMIITRIEQACLGRLVVNGNYQAIVADPYALCQWITGQEVTGLLYDGEFYSDFWRTHDIDKFACARSPMTWRGEWAVVTNKYKPYANEDGVVSDEEIERAEKIAKYYRYNTSGIITNVYGIYTLTFAGSDFDFDILFTTDNKQIINNTYQGERVTLYDVPKPKKKPNLTEEDLYISDTFSFGQQIGPLTNISTSIYALLPKFKEDSKEYNKLIERLKQCCVNQSKQIDKTKIGQDVKCIPKIWITKQKPEEGDSEETLKEKEFYNSILADKKPYFFKYKYKQSNKDLRAFEAEALEYTQASYRKIPINKLVEMYNEDPTLLTEEELHYTKSYLDRYPMIDTPCIMNNICKYIESQNFTIKQKIRTSSEFDYKTLQSSNFDITNYKKQYVRIADIVAGTFKEWEAKAKAQKKTNLEKSLNDNFNIAKFDRKVECALLKQTLLNVINNEESLTNLLIYLFYVDKPSYSKSNLWNMCGKQIYENIKNKMTNKTFYFPVKNENGSLKFLYENYQIEKIELKEPVVVEENYEENNTAEEGILLI